MTFIDSLPTSCHHEGDERCWCIGMKTEAGLPRRACSHDGGEGCWCKRDMRRLHSDPLMVSIGPDLLTSDAYRTIGNALRDRGEWETRTRSEVMAELHDAALTALRWVGVNKGHRADLTLIHDRTCASDYCAGVEGVKFVYPTELARTAG